MAGGTGRASNGVSELLHLKIFHNIFRSTAIDILSMSAYNDSNE